MKTLFMAVALQLAAMCMVWAQKPVLNIPFEFEKKRLASSDYDAYFLQSGTGTTFSLLLKDNEKTEYLLIDQNFKIVSKVDVDLKETVFDKGNNEYSGGTDRNNAFRYIYKKKLPSTRISYLFQTETVDFTTKTVNQAKLFEIPSEQKIITSFSDNNNFYTLTSDDDAKQLIVYSVNEAGEPKTNRIPFNVPSTAGKKRDKLSEYLSQLEVIKAGEEPDMSASVSFAKLFSTKGSLNFVINEEGHPTHLFRLSLPNFTAEEKFFDPGKTKEGSGEKLKVNSFLQGDRLFSMVLGRKDVSIVVQDAADQHTISQYTINEETSPAFFARSPVNDRRMGKSLSSKDVNKFRSLINVLDGGTKGIMVTPNKNGQLIVTVGTYDPIMLPGGGGYEGGYQRGPNYNNSPSPNMVYNPYLHYRPGFSTYMGDRARYYNTTYFKLLMDPSASKVEKGPVPTPVAEQIKDYLQGTDRKAKATNQFSMGQQQYYGYYDKDAKQYQVEEIKLQK